MQQLGFDSLGTSFDCACGKTHRIATEVCYVGSGAAERLAEFAAEHCGDSCLVLSDENTSPVGSSDVMAALSSVGKTAEETIYGAEPMIVTDTLGEEVAALASDFSFYVAVGAGALSDLAKYAGKKHGRPVLLYPTAASMNGYTSAVVAMEVNGLKTPVPCEPALGVFADPAVAATAPVRMSAAGVADYLSKCCAYPDWYADHFFRGMDFCERPHEYYALSQDALLAAAPAIGQSDPAAVGVCLEALLLSGLSMIVADSSAPSSGGEHLVSHYFDMKNLLTGTPADLHGTQVGLGTLHGLRLWEKVLALDPEKLDVDALADAHPSDSQICEWIEADWGEVAPEVIGQWRQKSLDLDKLKAELQNFKEHLPALSEAVRPYLLPSDVVAQAIRDAGGPTEPEELAVPLEEFEKSIRFARFLRNRFTILDLAAELGVE